MRRCIDVHAHVGKTVANNIGQTPGQMLERLVAAGVSNALLSPAAADRQVDGIADTKRMNDVVAGAVAAHPDVFLGGFGLVEIRHEEYAVREAVRVMDELGLLGLALHPGMEGYYLNVPLWIDPLFSELNDRAAICLLHSSPDPYSGESIRAVRDIVSEYPRITFFLGHAFLSEEQKNGAVALIRDLDNAFLDVAYQSDPRLAEELVAAVGAERVVFGTDQPFYDPAQVLQSIEDAALDEGDRELILHGNVERVLTATSVNRRKTASDPSRTQRRK